MGELVLLGRRAFAGDRVTLWKSKSVISCKRKGAGGGRVRLFGEGRERGTCISLICKKVERSRGSGVKRKEEGEKPRVQCGEKRGQAWSSFKCKEEKGKAIQGPAQKSSSATLKMWERKEWHREGVKRKDCPPKRGECAVETTHVEYELSSWGGLLHKALRETEKGAWEIEQRGSKVEESDHFS